jgi:penicillin-binding protein 1A
MRHAFEHACRRCTAVFSPALELDNFSVLTAACPHCGYAHGYDNRDGKILRLLREKQGLTESHPEPEAPVEAALTPPPEPPALETEPAPIPWTTTAVEPEYQGTDSFEQNEPEITREREPWRSRLPGIRQVVFVASTLATLLVVAVMVMQAIPVSDEEAKGYLAQLKSREADVVLDRNGHELNRLGVSGSEKALLTDYPRWQIDTLLFAEDKNFFHHHGVEYTAILRAVLNNALRLRYAQGASTITQQLARIMLQNRQKNILRKLSEIRLARALESQLSKPKILELYMNHVYLGHGNYSFPSAAKFYYDKTPAELTYNEFLSIVALIPSPERYSPLRNGRRLAGRMGALYERMRAAGAKVPDAAAYQAGMAAVTTQAERFSTETAFGSKSRVALWPAQYARDFLTQRHILSGENQNSARVYTTIDAELQARAEALLAKHVQNARQNFRSVIRSADQKEIRLKKKLQNAVLDSGLLLDLGGLPVAREADGGLQAALIALSPRTGEILAMVGGESFQSKNQLNRTVQMRRQTGSAIKPFIYAKAFSQHLIHAATLIDDTPYVVGSGSKTWAPENINGGFEGPMPARDALAKSRNIPAIRVGRLVGRDGVTELFSDFFFQSENALSERFSYDETVAIGTISLSPLEMARAFSVFLNNGFLNDPLLITRVESAEKSADMRKTHVDQLGLTAASKDRLLSQAEAQLMLSLLKSSGKKSGAGVSGIVGKTGTSSESRDLWFVGGGKEIVVAVWFGYDDMRYAIPGATGSALAAKLAGDFLRPGFKPADFKLQPGMVRLRVCPLTGRTASESCPHARSEVFLSGVVPEGECLHGISDEQSDFMAVMGESQFR